MNEIVIVGGGPTGLSLALNLANSKNKITVIEKSDLLGGSFFFFFFFLFFSY